MSRVPSIKSPIQRKILLSHIDGAQPFRAAYFSNAVYGLMKAGLLIGVPERSIRPTHTRLTCKGRDEVAAILAEAADLLITAGCLEPAIADKVRERPITLGWKSPAADPVAAIPPKSIP